MALFDFGKHPGLFFVWATLLPLVSFALLLVIGGVRLFLRKYQDAEGQPAVPPRWGAYIATGAISAAFVLSLIGAVIFFSEHAGHHDQADAAGHQAVGEHAHGKADEHNDAWAGRWDWVYVTDPTGGKVSRVIQLGYRIDSLSVLMFLMVTFVAALIHLFSIGYMSEETQPLVEDHQAHVTRRGRFGRFFLFLSLFCFSMLNLVLADNFFQVFLSWELVGICSYLLIGFYYERRSASTAANKAFITNRVGDAGFILGLLILFTYFGTFNFQDIFQQVRAPAKDAHGDPVAVAGQLVRGNEVGGADVGSRRIQFAADGSHVILLGDHIHASDLAPFKKDGKTPNTIDVLEDAGKGDDRTIPYWVLVVCGLGIFLGCVGKSAQFPLHVWLPDAMEGPTPVSALIHAATMVAAGVYLVGRVFPLFTPDVLLVIAYTGGITLFVAATIAIVMTDIKKVLAYSTVSQLGYMMLALGIGGWIAGLMHLLTHAFFKALLFLGSGSVIYGCHHEQEMTKMGGLYPKMKITALTMLIGVFAIAGIPLFSGWYSKDAILAQALGYVLVNKQHLLLFLLPLITAGITTFYMFRMWFLTFTGEPRDHHVHEHATESPWVMTVPLVALAFFSVVVAWPFSVRLWEAENSQLEHILHHSQPLAVQAEFGSVGDEPLLGDLKSAEESVRHQAHEVHNIAGMLASGIVLLAIVFAAAVYWKPFQVLDPAEAKEQFPGVHAFLTHKWYFDELYSAVVVRPALVVSQWARGFDLRLIDGFVHLLARFGVLLSRWDGLFDARIIDGIANTIADACYAVGARLRRVQTGYLRSYVLFLALAAIGAFAVLAYFVTQAAAAP